MSLVIETYHNSHVLLKEGTPVPYISNGKNGVYETIYTDIKLVSLRKGYKIYHYYVSNERVSEVLRSKSLVCE
jgi:hypothetical protein